MTATCGHAIDVLELPDLVKVSDTLYVAAFQLMKLLPARHIIESGIAEGLIRPDTHVVETSSGTFALGLALVCSRHRLRLTIVGDGAIDVALRRKLEVLGTRVIIVDKPKERGGIQQARLDVVHDLLARDSGAFWPAQYDNPKNPEAYEKLLPRFERAGLPAIDVLVGPVGSGGSMCGLTRALRRVRPALRSVAVDTHGSVLFGHPDRPRRLRGLGNSITPGNLDHALFDEVHWVSAEDAFRCMAALYRETGLFMGATSGAAFLVARWQARARQERVLCILPDEGTRYLADFIAWSAADAALADEPVTARFGEVTDGTWSRLAWNRATLQEMRQHG